MVPFLPKQVTYRAIIAYLIALASVSILYFSYAISVGFMALGLTCVVGFFGLTTYWTKEWGRISNKQFVENVFWVAVVFRLIWVVASYFFYNQVTGQPFEYQALDSVGYHTEAEWLASENWSVTWEYYFGPGFHGVSDVGYPLYLTFLYKIIGPQIFLTRVIKAFIGAYTCILIYRLSVRTFGEEVGRMAGLMAALMPNLIFYCGYHLKETEMLFLEVAFLERLDYLIRGKRITFWNVLLPSLLAGSLFFFRTVLGAAAVFAFATSVLVSSAPTMKRGWRRTAIIGWGLLCLIVVSGGTIMTEIEGYWEGRNENVIKKRTQQTLRGNQWAQYATGTVMAPIVMALPFSTMVDVDEQYSQQEKHGGNFCRTFMSFFAVLAVIVSIIRKKWRDFALIGAFAFAYLGVVSLSGFSNSERFLLPGLPGLIMMWAYGVSALNAKSFKWMNLWCAFVVLIEVAWAFFKLGSRGLF